MAKQQGLNLRYADYMSARSVSAKEGDPTVSGAVVGVEPDGDIMVIARVEDLVRCSTVGAIIVPDRQLMGEAHRRIGWLRDCREAQQANRPAFMPFYQMLLILGTGTLVGGTFKDWAVTIALLLAGLACLLEFGPYAQNWLKARNKPQA